MALTWISWNAATEASVVVAAAGLVGRVSTRQWLASASALARELAIVLGLYAMWRIVGTVSVLKVDGAIRAGEHIWDLERALHLPNEHGLQHLFLKSDQLIQACNVYYASVHIPLMLVFLPWLWFAGMLMPRGKLPRKDTEIVILRVAHNCHCEYERRHHERIAQTVGLGADDVEWQVLPRFRHRPSRPQVADSCVVTLQGSWASPGPQARRGTT